MLKKKPETAAQGEQIQQVPVAELHPFKDHPFKVLDDDQAILQMVESNLQRETIRPSERAFAYKMKLEALKH